MSEKERVKIRMSKVILEKIDAYQKENGLPTRTAAILELIKKVLRNNSKLLLDRNSSPTFASLRSGRLLSELR